jgi:hypothetical protein
MDYESLKTRHRAERDTWPQPLSLRVHRALSWLQRAEQETEDDDARFVFLWIAFNAAYANEIHDRQNFSEQRLFRAFLGRLIESDEEQRLYQLLWKAFPNSVRMLIDNRYVYQPFWDFHNGKRDAADWEASFARSKAAAHRAMGKQDTLKVLGIVFNRLYTLRNQLVHGGATWNGSVNRSQMKQGADLLGELVPTVIWLMMERPEGVWGEACYPVVD